jgi:hypothetical protein
MCGFHVIFVSKITPRYVILFTKDIVSVQCEKSIRWFNSMGEVDCLGLRSEVTLRLSQSQSYFAIDSLSISTSW